MSELPDSLVQRLYFINSSTRLNAAEKPLRDTLRMMGWAGGKGLGREGECRADLEFCDFRHLEGNRSEAAPGQAGGEGRLPAGRGFVDPGRARRRRATGQRA
jgi:hypothetical protein